jgi:large subunit ribosomal protein L35
MQRLRARRADHLYSGQYQRTARPNLSAASPRKWNRPLAKGVLPAYDEALKIIRDDSRSLQREVKELRIALVKAENAHGPNEDTPTLIREKLAILEVQSEINLPHTRWMCANGMGR